MAIDPATAAKLAQLALKAKEKAKGLAPESVKQILAAFNQLKKLAIWGIPLAWLAGVLIILMFLFGEVAPDLNCDNGGSVTPGIFKPSDEGGANMTAVQMAVTVGRKLNASDKVMLSMFETGIVESGWRNIASDKIPESKKYAHDWYRAPSKGMSHPITHDPNQSLPAGSGRDAPGDHASIGIFQQQIGMDWGNTQQILDPSHAANEYLTRAIKWEKNHPDASAGDIAANVQRPRADLRGKYGDAEEQARGLMAKAGGLPDASGVDVGTTCTGDGTFQVGSIAEIKQGGVTYKVPVPTGQQGIVIAAALSQLGHPYVWAGGDFKGPTKGDCRYRDDSGNCEIGFDCSGLILYSYHKIGVNFYGEHLARSQRQWVMDKRPYGNLVNAEHQPGDVLYWGGNAHHTAMYLGKVNGKDMMIEAPTFGKTVKLSPVRMNDLSYWGRIIEPGAPAATPAPAPAK